MAWVAGPQGPGHRRGCASVQSRTEHEAKGVTATIHTCINFLEIPTFAIYEATKIYLNLFCVPHHLRSEGPGPKKLCRVLKLAKGSAWNTLRQLPTVGPPPEDLDPN